PGVYSRSPWACCWPSRVSPRERTRSPREPTPRQRPAHLARRSMSAEDSRGRTATPSVNERATDTMQAIVQDSYGSPDILCLRDIERPQIAANEVLIRVCAAGVDFGVWHLVTGLPYLIRLAGFGLRAPRNPVPGMDLA